MSIVIHLTLNHMINIPVQINKLCRQYGISDYTINPDGSIDVNENVDLSNKNLYNLPLIFNKVNGDFHCYSNYLTTLHGAPKYVNGSFSCGYNYLTSLEGCPQTINGSFGCSNNQLISLIGCPEEIKGDFHCYSNKLKSLEGAPKYNGIMFTCHKNLISTLEHCPNITCNTYEFYNNKFQEIVMEKLLKNNNEENINIFLKYQDHYEVWTNGFNNGNFDLLIDDINNGLR